MEKFDYAAQDEKIVEFETELFTYGQHVKENTVIAFENPPNNRIPVFYFKDSSNIPKGLREVCYKIFYKYFPYGKQASF
ncbi:hypothetical protein KXQ82_15430 [Mucilaginibacter sp. HMF5004]|uniref:hypothetical protein n=1 Tax=Mucilaginibacter rivuli TaxID=2857527 RepID=UPI001C5CD86C|nr:hypothetical protein [Mucilaginibacter rivuli]MBW4891116.1 hypothetical protein [Mucilaginibacter rivuli]